MNAKRASDIRLQEGVDYVVEEGKWVFTRAYHLARGSCCENGCRHCPYEAVDAGERCVEPAPGSRTKTCPGCGGTFACHSGGCWCDRVQVPAEILGQLRERFADCLCPGCLNKAAEKNEGSGR